ncbi:MAG: T9SS type A sorting domain-containing protein [Bacteroidia bacterium]
MKITMFSLFFILSCWSLSYGQDFQLEWLKSLGGTEDEVISGFEVDALGNVTIAGVFENNLCINDSLCFYTSGLGDWDIFVVQYDSLGAIRWAKTFGGNKEDWVFDMALSPEGEIYITGFFTGPAKFDSLQLTPNYYRAGYLVKMSSDGVILNHLQTWGNLVDIFEHVTVNKDGQLWLVGFIESDSLDFGNGIIIRRKGPYNDVFALALNPDLKPFSFAQLYSKNDVFPSLRRFDAVSDSVGNLYFSGTYNDTLYFNEEGFSQGLDWHNYIAKVTPDGNLVKMNLFNGRELMPANLKVDNVNSLYVSGTLRASKISWGQVNIISDSTLSYFVGKLSSKLEPDWLFQNSGFQGLYNSQDLMVNALGVYSIGGFDRSYSISDTILTAHPSPQSDSDILILQHDLETGKLKGLSHLPGPVSEYGARLTSNESCQLYFCGAFNNTLTQLDTFTLRNSSFFTTDLLVGKFVDLDTVKFIPPLDTIFDSITIYPNPFIDQISIAGLPVDERVTVSLYDLLGRKHIEYSTLNINTKITLFNLSYLPKATYILSVESPAKHYAKKVRN